MEICISVCNDGSAAVIEEDMYPHLHSENEMQMSRILVKEML